MAKHQIFPHGKPEEHTDGVWQVRGSLSFPLPRYMTIIRLSDGGLLIYSPVAMDKAGMKALEALGEPKVILAPHVYHIMDVGFYVDRYPDAQLIAPVKVADKLREDGVTADADVDALAAHGIQHAMVAGSKCDEVMLELDTAAGRTLVFTDVVSVPAKKGLFLKILGPPGNFGVPRIVKCRQIKEKPALAKFLNELADGDDIGLMLLAHAPPVTRDCAARLREAANGL